MSSTSIKFMEIFRFFSQKWAWWLVQHDVRLFYFTTPEKHDYAIPYFNA